MEPLTDCPYLEAMLHSRYVGTPQSASHSSKAHVKLIFNIGCYDATSLTGNKNKYSINTVDQLIEKRRSIGQKK